jgi:CRP/FNR family transcriptional regulator
MGDETEEGVRLKIKLTHQEIAQMIGASRETVSRLMSQLKRQQVIAVGDSGLLVKDKTALAQKARHRKPS